jgi:hypothetical protein
LKSPTTNMFNRVAYNFDSTGGNESAGLLEIWVKNMSYQEYVINVVQNNNYMTENTSGIVLFESTGSSTQPSGSTLITAITADS